MEHFYFSKYIISPNENITFDEITKQLKLKFTKGSLSLLKICIDKQEINEITPELIKKGIKGSFYNIRLHIMTVVKEAVSKKKLLEIMTLTSIKSKPYIDEYIDENEIIFIQPNEIDELRLDDFRTRLSYKWQYQSE